MFKECVYKTVRNIPKGSVMSYGQVAAACDKPRAARIVGQIARFGPSDIPWHRVVYKDGRLARRFPNGGRDEQKRRLELEGVVIEDYSVKMKEYSIEL